MGGSSRGSRSISAKINSETNSLSLYSERSNQQALAPSRKRAFISFHMEDEAMVNLLRHQAKDSRYELDFKDHSVKEPFDSHWRAQVRQKIAESDVVIVMIGAETHTREAVLWEINTAYAMDKKVIGVRIHRDENHAIPAPLISNNAPIVYWNILDVQNEIENPT